MEKRTEGAWILHHTKKIQGVTHAPDFEDIEIAGKCGILLSNLAASDEESTLSSTKVKAIATSSNIKKAELTGILGTLEDAKLIDKTSKGDVSVLGITSSNMLSHTAEIFDELTPDSIQKAALELTDESSNKPVGEKFLKEYISDNFKLDNNTNTKLFEQAEQIGIVDYDDFEGEKVYFNGNLFKKDSIEKTSKVLSSFSADDSRKVAEVDALLTKEGCVTYEAAKRILGINLLKKLQSIAMYDFNEVSNSAHSKVLLTKPSSFSKFGNPFEDDALDMAKAFISSLIYGMKVSSSGRGRIQSKDMLIFTLKKLLRGGKVGPCTAIGEDYKILEMKRVIELEYSHNGRYFMRLLKHDIAKIALDVVEKGDNAEQATIERYVNSSSVSTYVGPETNRMRLRKDTSNNVDISELLKTMRSN